MTKKIISLGPYEQLVFSPGTFVECSSRCMLLSLVYCLSNHPDTLLSDSVEQVIAVAFALERLPASDFCEMFDVSDSHGLDSLNEGMMGLLSIHEQETDQSETLVLIVTKDSTYHVFSFKRNQLFDTLYDQSQWPLFCKQIHENAFRSHVQLISCKKGDS